ncbi:MAG TPA: hypothetical protein VJM50_21220, partial [Pyrinomonadaceae bacterium]|nr:hypothetical protein [Pyrinomonadaceae bacterium]
MDGTNSTYDTQRTASPSASIAAPACSRSRPRLSQHGRADLHRLGYPGGLGQVLVVAAVIDVRKCFTAYVVFVGSENRNWWRFFLRRGWRHVYVILPTYYPKPGLSAVAYSQVINPWTDHIRSDVLFQSPRSVAEAALKEGATCVISLPVDQKFSGKYLPRGLLTCVSLTKALLSIGAWHVWTPEQLARWLLQNGGE